MRALARPFLVVLLALSLLMQSFVVLACGVHEVDHAMAAAGASTADISIDGAACDGAARDGEPVPGESRGDEPQEDAFHASLHRGGCCASTASVIPVVPSFALSDVDGDRVVAGLCRGVADAYAPNLLRPPIRRT